MAGSVNKVILIGNLGKEPEIRRLENGLIVANFSIATSETYIEKNSGEKREITDWHNISAWKGLAEVVEKYIHKGTKVYIEGKLKTRNWQDKDGQTKYVTEVIADEIQILSSKDTNMQNKPIYPTHTIISPSEINDLIDDENDKDLF
jgi:single-strand DNA-binding protein